MSDKQYNLCNNPEGFSTLRNRKWHIPCRFGDHNVDAIVKKNAKRKY